MSEHANLMRQLVRAFNGDEEYTINVLETTASTFDRWVRGVMKPRDVAITLARLFIWARKTGRYDTMITSLSEPPPPREFRAKLGISQKSFANLLGVYKTSYRQWEYGERPISKQTKRLFACIWFLYYAGLLNEYKETSGAVKKSVNRREYRKIGITY